MKKTWVIVVVSIGLSALLVFAGLLTPRNEMLELFDRVKAALGKEWKKQTVTEVSSLVYADAEGNTIIYYVCFTKYYEADAGKQTGLHTDAVSAVIDPNEAESCRECAVDDLPAAVYQKDGRAYLCWTVTREISCVIEFDPAIEREADIFQMAESVPFNNRYESK